MTLGPWIKKSEYVPLRKERAVQVFPAQDKNQIANVHKYLRVVTRVRTDTGAEVHKSAAIILASSMALSPTLK